jgi:hypothetical protein
VEESNKKVQKSAGTRGAGQLDSEEKDFSKQKSEKRMTRFKEENRHHFEPIDLYITPRPCTKTKKVKLVQYLRLESRHLPCTTYDQPRGNI